MDDGAGAAELFDRATGATALAVDEADLEDDKLIMRVELGVEEAAAEDEAESDVALTSVARTGTRDVEIVEDALQAFRQVVVWR